LAVEVMALAVLAAAVLVLVAAATAPVAQVEEARRPATQEPMVFAWRTARQSA
jgi:hypothetical protein